MMRAFVGIGLPPALRRKILEAVTPFRPRLPRVAWVAEENLHVTLKFLGEVPKARIPGVVASLDRSAQGIGPFDLFVESFGAFPPQGAPRVLWAGVREPLELVGKLQQNMEEFLSGAGFPREGRAFHPHVTVGRAKGPVPAAEVEALLVTFSATLFGVARVRSFQLYESRLAPGGPKYSVLRDFPLEGEKGP